MWDRLFRRTGIQPVTARTAAQARAILAAEPKVHTLAAARFDELAARGNLGSEFSALWEADICMALAWHGVSLSVMGARSDEVLRELALEAATKRRFASIVGETASVRAVWDHVSATIGPAREERFSQPLLEFSRVPSAVGRGVPASRTIVRQATIQEVGLVYPVAVAMFREEVGTNPERPDGGRAYRARVKRLIEQRRTYVVREGDVIVFKADVGALFEGVAQIHGVWTHPDYRGRGIASRAMAEMVPLIRRDHAPCVTLYVNSFNQAARRAYHNAGFTQIGELGTVLL